MPQSPTIDLRTLEALGCRDELGRPIVESVEIVPGGTVAVSPAAFGSTDPASGRIFERPYAGAWTETSYAVDPVRLYRIRGATVHSLAGVVMVKVPESDDGWYRYRLLDETLQCIVPEEHLIAMDLAAGEITVNSRKTTRIERRAVHLLADGGDNYYHWMIDILSRLSVLPDEFRDDLFLVPPLGADFQWDSLRAIAADRPMLLQSIGRGESVIVDELVLIPNIGGLGNWPRPEQLAVVDRLPRGSGAEAARNPRIYISRRKDTKRRLENEDEVLCLLETAGYDILTLDGMPLAEQASRFAAATHIVAPHGAGLTNVVFCRPGTALFELHSSLYANWLFRRLGNLRGVRYGCMLGETLGAWEPLRPHDKPWRVCIDRLRDELNDAGFLG